MSRYKSTQDQINRELDAMYKDMRDPEKHEEAELVASHKKNVTRTTKRYGLD